MNDPVERLVHAIADHDRDALTSVLAPDVDFRGLTPGRAWEGTTAADVVEAVLGHWFEDSDHVEALTRFQRGPAVVDVQQVAYRFDVVNDRGPHTVEQQVYYRTKDDRITYLRVLCSGFRPRG
jgi:hypothetical protein